MARCKNSRLATLLLLLLTVGYFKECESKSTGTATTTVGQTPRQFSLSTSNDVEVQQARAVVYVPVTTLTMTTTVVLTHVASVISVRPPEIHGPPFTTLFPTPVTVYSTEYVTSVGVVTSVVSQLSTIAPQVTSWSYAAQPTTFFQPLTTISPVSDILIQPTVISSVIEIQTQPSEILPVSDIIIQPTVISSVIEIQTQPSEILPVSDIIIQPTVISSASVPTAISSANVATVITPAAGQGPSPTGSLTPPNGSPLSLPSVNAQCKDNCDFTVAGKCYNSVDSALKAVSNGGTVSVRNGAVMTGQATTTKSVYFVGCGGGRAQVQVKMNESHGGAVIATGNKQTIGFFNLEITGSGSNAFSSLLRTPDLGDGQWTSEIKTGPVDLFIDNCRFSNFRTQARGGSVIFIGKTNKVSITNSEFRNNICVPIKGKNRWDGGGAVWIIKLQKQGWFSGNVFSGNEHHFGHSVGAALMVLDMSESSRVDLQGNTFEKNKASAGGAIYFREVRKQSILNIDSTFRSNECIWSKEYGCRGGAAWIQNIEGDVYMTGTFDGNVADGGRGAVAANNRVRANGRVILSGTYTNNKCTKGAAVWDTLQGFQLKAQFTMLPSTRFSGNKGKDGKDIILQLYTNRYYQDPEKRNILRTETQWINSGKLWNFYGGTHNPYDIVEFK